MYSKRHLHLLNSLGIVFKQADRLLVFRVKVIAID